MIEIYTKKLNKVLNENVNVTKPQGLQHLLKYVCVIVNNMLTAAVKSKYDCPRFIINVAPGPTRASTQLRSSKGKKTRRRGSTTRE